MHHLMVEHAEHLLRKQYLAYPVVMIQRRLRAPTDVQRAVNMRAAPVHDLAKLLPVLHLFKFHLFHRRAGDNHTVVILILHVLKGLVEADHVFLRCMLRHPADRQKLHINLQRCIAQEPRELGLGDDLGWHQV